MIGTNSHCTQTTQSEKVEKIATLLTKQPTKGKKASTKLYLLYIRRHMYFKMERREYIHNHSKCSDCRSLF